MKLDSNDVAPQQDPDELTNAFKKEDLFDHKRQAKLQTETREIERSHLQKMVTRRGFIRFSDYQSKLRMMDTAMFLFGLKLHRQEGHIKFYDADFLNSLHVSSQLFSERTLGDCCKLVNEALSNAGYKGKLFEVGQLREIDDYKLSEAMVGSNKRMRISLRFNSFNDALEAHLALSSMSHTSS